MRGRDLFQRKIIMRVTHRRGAKALAEGRRFSAKNDKVRDWKWTYHRTVIAEVLPMNSEGIPWTLKIDFGGWTTSRDTLERINAVLEQLNVKDRFHVIKGDLHMSGSPHPFDEETWILNHE